MSQTDSYNVWPIKSMPDSMQTASELPVLSETEEGMSYRSIYPEVYYKLLPYILMASDLIFSYGMMPSEEKLEEITEDIFTDFCKMHPDMAGYMGKSEPPEAVPTFNGGFRGSRGFGPGFGGFRRMGLGRDLIFALLLSQLFNRGGYIY